MKKQTLISAVILSVILFLPFGEGLGGACLAQLRGINYQTVAIDENGKEIPGIVRR